GCVRLCMFAHLSIQRECRHQYGVWAEEEVTDRKTPPVSDPPLSLMAGPVVQHVAPLTEGAQIGQPIVRRINVERRGGKNNARHPKCGRFHQIGPPGRPPTTIPPGRRPLVEPASVRQTAHEGEVWTATTLAPPSSTLKPYPAAQFAPVWWVEGTQLRA